jgi:Domain of unknown function (DUF4290)
MQYNTEKDKIHITEYGRNIQNLLLLANTYEDRAYRTAYVERVLEMMYLLDPQVKIVEDYRNKLWSHAFKITEYQLDVDVPEGVVIAPCPCLTRKKRQNTGITVSTLPE